jgi:ribonuclease HI
MEEKLVKVFTDGSSIANGKPNCISGSGVFFPKSGLSYSINSTEASKICNIPLEIQSNNVAELFGILLALILTEDKTVELMIYSDSMYCINSICVWSKNWAKNNWITSTSSPVKNKGILQKILEEKAKFKAVYFKHVRGHKKEPEDKNSEEWFNWFGNDKSDLLAFYSIRYIKVTHN